MRYTMYHAWFRLSINVVLLLLVECICCTQPTAWAQKVEGPRPVPEVRRQEVRTERATPKADVWDRAPKTAAAKPAADVARKVDISKAADTAKLDRERQLRAKATAKADVWDRPIRPPVKEAPTSRAAQREVMRQQKIPTSQAPDKQRSTKAGRQYDYTISKPGGGTEKRVVQRNVGVDRSHPGEVHVEGGRPKTNGQVDALGRERLQNNKTKVNVTPNGK